MKLAIGTTNRIKIQAVEEVIIDYPLFAGMQIDSVSVSSEISEQPLSKNAIWYGDNSRKE